MVTKKKTIKKSPHPDLTLFAVEYSQVVYEDYCMLVEAKSEEEIENNWANIDETINEVALNGYESSYLLGEDGTIGETSIRIVKVSLEGQGQTELEYLPTEYGNHLMVNSNHFEYEYDGIEDASHTEKLD